MQCEDVISSQPFPFSVTSRPGARTYYLSADTKQA